MTLGTDTADDTGTGTAIDARLPAISDVLIAGGGCAGLALAMAVAEQSPGRSVTVLDGRTADDPRTWCSWRDGDDPVPEAVSASWTRWQVRTHAGTSTGVDTEHPYRMTRAADHRAAVLARLADHDAVRFRQGVHVTAVEPGTIARGTGLVRTTHGDAAGRHVVDARGTAPTVTTDRRSVHLHQRFLGRWVRATRPVFDHRTVTLMDFTGVQDTGAVQFMYVLPVSRTLALVESTVFTTDRTEPIAFRRHVAEYLAARWGLSADEWTSEGDEAGCIPMTDAAPPATPVTTVGVAAGITRPATGYAFARIHRQAPVVAAQLLAGAPVPPFRDRPRTRALDAVFLRFLRDDPALAADVFRRMFALPGPLVVRFLTERSTLRDDLRIVLALPKAPFLRALGRTLVERARRR